MGERMDPVSCEGDRQQISSGEARAFSQSGLE